MLLKGSPKGLSNAGPYQTKKWVKKSLPNWTPFFALMNDYIYIVYLSCIGPSGAPRQFPGKDDEWWGQGREQGSVLHASLLHLH